MFLFKPKKTESTLFNPTSCGSVSWSGGHAEEALQAPCPYSDRRGRGTEWQTWTRRCHREFTHLPCRNLHFGAGVFFWVAQEGSPNFCWDNIPLLSLADHLRVISQQMLAGLPTARLRQKSRGTKSARRPAKMKRRAVSCSTNPSCPATMVSYKRAPSWIAAGNRFFPVSPMCAAQEIVRKTHFINVFHYHDAWRFAGRFLRLLDFSSFELDFRHGCGSFLGVG